MPEQQFTGCEGRITTEAGSFFERVPDGCDAYLLKHIIHDWSDEHCRTILDLMREKLPKHGRVLVCEMVVSDEPGPTPAKLLDIEMLVMTVGGKERTPEEFARAVRIIRLAAQPHRSDRPPDLGDRGGAGLSAFSALARSPSTDRRGSPAHRP